jgi:hypothetical protein
VAASQEDIMEARYWQQLARLADGLRYAILARLLHSPVSLHRLYLDMLEAADRGALPAYPTLAEVVDEIRLYTRLGLVAEGGSGLLYINTEKLSTRDRALVEAWMEKLGYTTAAHAPVPAASAAEAEA